MNSLRTYLTWCLCFAFVFVMAQKESSELPFKELSSYPEEFTANNLTARMIESLGFRYYWASEGFTESDLAFKLTEDTRSIKATLDHIYDLSLIIRNSAEKLMNKRSERPEMNYEEVRSATLQNLNVAMEIIGRSEGMEEFEILFPSGSYPFWNQINGPISDAIWHCGQLAILRRASGNPINSKVNHFTGTVRD